MAKQSDIAPKTRELFIDYDDARRDWAKNAKLDIEFYYNQQWTEEEKKVLEARNQAPLVINRIRPILRSMKAVMTANSPRFLAFPRGEEDNKRAFLFSGIMEYVWYISNGNLELRDAIHDMQLRGLGFLRIDVDQLADNNKGEVKIERMDSFEVWIDPRSKKRDFSDAAHMIIKKTVTVEEAINMFPGKATTIKKNSGGSDESISTNQHAAEGQSTWGDPPKGREDDTVDLYERYTKTLKDQFIITEPGQQPQIVDKLTQEQKDLFGAELIDITKIRVPQVKKYLTVGEQGFISEETLPIREYPLLPIISDWTGDPYPMSPVRFVRGIQQEINKRRSLMIGSAQALSSPSVIAHEKNFTDKEQQDNFLSALGTPGGLAVWGGPTGDGSPAPPQIAQGAALPAAFFQLEQEAKQDMEFGLGHFLLQLGGSQGAPETFRGTLAIEEFGSRVLRMQMQEVENILGLAGNIVIQFAQRLYKIPKILRIMTPEGDLQKFDTPDGNNQEQMVINQTSGDWSDITVGQFDLVVKGGSTLPTNRMAWAEHNKELFSAGIIDQEAVLKELDMKDRDEILARTSVTKQLSGIVEEQENKIKNLESVMKTMDNELRRQDREIESTEFEAEATVTLNKLVTEIKLKVDNIETENSRAALKAEQAIDKAVAALNDAAKTSTKGER